MDLQRPVEERSQYAFEFMGWYPTKFARCQSNPLLRLACLLRDRKELLEAEEIYKNTDLIIDISGYALSSVFSDNNCRIYLEHFFFAQAFHIPVYIMPQSFGPFDFADERKYIDVLIRRLLPTAKIICTREKQGYELLTEKYGLNNVLMAPDLVLNNRSINVDHVYKHYVPAILPHIEKNSIAIVPNSNNQRWGNSRAIRRAYQMVVERAIKQGQSVYFIYHAAEDLKMCVEIMQMFDGCKKVHLIDKELNCLEFNTLLPQFNFLIASRYHAIVHAYKCTVPCVILGWSQKYMDLAETFGQGKYAFDTRRMLEPELLAEACDRIYENRDIEKKKITEILGKIQKFNIFDLISEI